MLWREVADLKARNADADARIERLTQIPEGLRPRPVGPTIGIARLGERRR